MKNPHKKTDYLIAGVLFAVALIAAITLALLGGTKEADASPRASIACFPAKLWSAKPGQRPCAITRIYEDGSGRLYLGTARRTVAWCTIPNVREQKAGQGFTIRCWKRAN